MTRSGKWDGLHGRLKDVFDKMDSHINASTESKGMGTWIRDGMKLIRDILVFQEEQQEQGLAEIKDSHALEIGKLKEQHSKQVEMMKQESDELQRELTTLKQESHTLQKELQECKGAIREEGECTILSEVEVLKMANAKMQEDLVAAKKEMTQGWADVVKKEVEKGWTEVTKKHRPTPTPNIIHDTLEEEKKRRVRALNVRVSGMKEGASPREDATSLCQKLGVEEPFPFTDVWRAGKDTTRERPLLLKFPDSAHRQSFLERRLALKGEKIYLDDDLTPTQVAHRRASMVQVHEARQAGKWAVYRDGRVIITERRPK